MRIIARFEKGEAVRFVSHLDIQRTFQRAFRRADIPLAYSQGFISVILFIPHLLYFLVLLLIVYTPAAFVCNGAFPGLYKRSGMV